MPTERISLVPLGELVRWSRNYRVGNVEAIVASITRFGFNGALRVWRDHEVMAGNHALVALQTMKANGAAAPKGVETRGDGEWLVPCIDIAHLNRKEAEAFAVADNRTQELGTEDAESLDALLRELADFDPEAFLATGYTSDDLLEVAADDTRERRGQSVLRQRFVVPPFSVLDARQGYWQERKQEWLSLGIKSELGRAQGLLMTGPLSRDMNHYYRRKTRQAASA